ncbi:MAG TPA: hypothetical protein VH186_09770 [Chloroflexia bacterium]|nr:hypothetical protein [Chloroflexia bacterium]
MPSIFPIWWIALTAGVALVASLLLLTWRYKEIPLWERLVISSLVGLSIFLWRLSGNIKELNDDPLPPFSPNDWLCPAVTYIWLRLYGAFRRPVELEPKGWEEACAFLTIVSFVVNVLVI